MSQERHIHIIASGENVHNTMPKAIKGFNIDKAIIVVDKDVYENTGKNKRYPGIIDSITKVENMTKEIMIKTEIKRIDKISLDSVRDAVLEIVADNKKEFPGDKLVLYFNVTGGTKILSNGLFMMAIWMGGRPYHVGEDNVLQELIIPKVHSDDIRKNINYQTILDILSKKQNGTEYRKNLFDDLQEKYDPIREKDKKAKRNLAQGTLSKWTADLENWGLITIKNPQGNKKDKVYTITKDGEFTLKFIKATSND